MKFILLALLICSGCITSPLMNDLPEEEQTEEEMQREAEISADAVISVKAQREIIKQRWADRFKTNSATYEKVEP